MFSWTIVGGGPHGVILANALRRVALVPSDEISIVDEHPEPLADWNRRTSACGMRYLRSPGAHGLEPDFRAIAHTACATGQSLAERSVAPYHRPSLELFRAHAHTSTSALKPLWITGRVAAISRRTSHAIRISLADGRHLDSQNVILAVGANPNARLPDWAVDADPQRISHVYDPTFDPDGIHPAERVAVIGGGISAVQFALALAGRLETAPLVVSRRPLSVSQFDSDPCYIGPGCMEAFLANSVERRRAVLQSARRPGTITPGIRDRFAAAVARGAVLHRVASVQSTIRSANGVTLAAADESRVGPACDRVVCATGFESGLPAANLIDQIAVAFGGERDLKRDTHGYPVLGDDLSWADGLYVTGKLAELELGPSAANLIGAHNAAKRIVSSLSGPPIRVPQAWHRYGSVTKRGARNPAGRSRA